jgi:hypothetical protein
MVPGAQCAIAAFCADQAIVQDPVWLALDFSERQIGESNPLKRFPS